MPKWLDRRFIFAVPISLWVAWLLIRFVLKRTYGDVRYQELGQWGDSFGSLNALFAGLAFAAILYTLWHQQDQAKEISRDQHKTRFDATFFQLLELFNQARSRVRYFHDRDAVYDLESTDKLHRGTKAFRYAWRGLKIHLPEDLDELEPKKCGRLYVEKIHSRFESDLGPYYRMIHTILRRIDDDQVLTQDEKDTYANIFRTQLTSYELQMIGFNGLSVVSGDLKNYIYKYHLLKYIPKSLDRRKIMEKLYERDAFRGRREVLDDDIP